MDDEKRTLQHKLQNAEQEKRALKSLLDKAADEIDDLAEADCSQSAIERAKTQAERLRKIGNPNSES
ncbi:hypothetical protein [Qipengyuania oceanensis]|uniref:Uncharacterized protein n=1 Tax=Qipengyuania oceanensis TaxID=1463597 RepID=A0A844YM04_9SPHN|nr:hypothetical protein [Qipengyuania oceanensis]MXO63954.1 hypothetical protein [Qipengyuania oceanensis]